MANEEEKPKAASSARAEKSLLEQLISQFKAKDVQKGGATFDEVVWAEKLQKRDLPKIRCVGRDWFGYDSGRWAACDRAQFGPTALRSLPRRHKTARKAASLLDHVEMASQVPPAELCGFYKERIDPEGNRSFLLNVGNGVLILHPEEGGLEIKEHSETYGFTLQAASKYDPKAECPRFMELLHEQLPDEEDRELMHCFAGNVLCPTAQFEASLISYGEAGLGKSKLALGIANALQDERAEGDLVANLSISQLCDNKGYSLPKLKVSALNLGTEVKTTDLDDSSNFKQLVSGEKVETRSIYSRPFAMMTTCKFWFLANDVPRFKDGGSAETRRLRFLKFDVTPAKRDTQLLAKLRAEREGIFRWMVEGLIRLMEKGGVPQGGPRSRAVLEKFEMANDTVGWFVSKHCVLDPALEIKKEWLLQAFEDFLTDNGLSKRHAEDWFFKKLYQKYNATGPTRHRTLESPDPQRFVSGLRLKREGE